MYCGCFSNNLDDKDTMQYNTMKFVDKTRANTSIRGAQTFAKANPVQIQNLVWTFLSPVVKFS